MPTEDYKLKHGLFDDLRYDYPIIGRDEELIKLENFINKESSGSRTFLIIGDYGTGKTFLFNKIQEKFRDGTYENSDKSLVIPMRLVEGEAETKIAHSIVTRAFRNIGYAKIYEIATKISTLDERHYNIAFTKIIAGIKDKHRFAFDWFCGKSLTSKEKTTLGISSNLSTSREALEIFYDFLKLLKQAEINNVYLLIDEFEYVVTVYNQKQVDAILYVFKDIYDKYGVAPDSMAKTIFIIAMTPACWDFLNNLGQRSGVGGGGSVPWMDRISPKINQIELLSLSEDENESLLMKRIEKNRLEHAGELPTPSWPFVSPEFFTLIYEKSKGNPRRSLKYCDHVFECGIQDNVSEFDGEYTKKLLDKL